MDRAFYELTHDNMARQRNKQKQKYDAKIDKKNVIQSNGTNLEEKHEQEKYLTNSQVNKKILLCLFLCVLVTTLLIGIYHLFSGMWFLILTYFLFIRIPPQEIDSDFCSRFLCKL